jgi:hypothetical protein
MLNNRKHFVAHSFLNCLLVVVLLLCPFWARTQDAVSFLKAETVSASAGDAPLAAGHEQPFNFTRNLIFFNASVDGNPGKYILDTGAPTLLLNNRGLVSGSVKSSGLATGGSVALANQKVESFEMGGRSLGRRWALTCAPWKAGWGNGLTASWVMNFSGAAKLELTFPSENFNCCVPAVLPATRGSLPTLYFVLSTSITCR